MTRHTLTLTVATVTAGLLASVLLAVHRRDTDDSRRVYLSADSWPVHGEAAYRIGTGPTHAGPDQRPVAIASLAKLMTAYVVLHELPLGRGDGRSFTVRAADVADYRTRRQTDQSVCAVRVGERITERQALLALLLPSANNIAVLLAERVSGSVPRFVALMNRTAHRLGMTHTVYTDPSGYDPRTRSTADDQLHLATAAAHNDTLTELAAAPSAQLPVAGRVTNTDSLLGSDGFTGLKTGSDDAAGGCFAFTSWRVVDRQVVLMVGVVLGQEGHHAVTAGLQAARQLVDRVAPVAAGA